MDVLRTPDDRFQGLPDYPFAPNYLSVDAGDGTPLRMHHLDEGPTDGEVVLLLHGEPSWSYLYRWMIPVLVDAGLRAVAIDLVGFGRSDKPVQRTDYTYQRHVDWTWSAVEQLGLDGITLVGQDWGGLIGLRLVGEHPERFARVVAANTMLPTGDHHPGKAFLAWQKFSQEVPVFPAGQIVNGATVADLPAEVIAAYDAPFPDERYKAGARQFPMLVPVSPDDPAAPATPRRLGGVGPLRQTVPVRVLRLRSHHRCGRTRAARPGPGRGRSTARHDRLGGSLPAGGEGSRVGRGGGGLHRRQPAPVHGVRTQLNGMSLVPLDSW